MKKITTLALVAISIISCQQQNNKTTTLSNPETPAVSQSNTDLESHLDKQEDLKEHIIQLAKKKDSLQNVLKGTKESMTRINETKIDKGTEGVKAKLNELKGQKENFEEQLNLQKKEMDLATKKIDILKQEKTVYDEQKKALYDKGAKPKEFVVVDSLLNGITKKLLDQNKRVKTLNRNVADVEEQVLSITEQRGFLSSKIRENYNAQEIFEEFAKEEDTKITTQIAAIDAEMSKLNGDVSSINSTVAGLHSNIEKEQAEQDIKLSEVEAQEKTNNRLKIAGIAIVLIALLFGLFYIVGKRKKNNAKK